MRTNALTRSDLEILLEVLKEVASVTKGVPESEKMDTLEAYYERHQIQVQARLFGGYLYH